MTIGNIVKVGDIVRVEDIHHDAPHFYEVARKHFDGVISQPASFKHTFDEITAIYRYNGKDFKCIWGREYMSENKMTTETLKTAVSNMNSYLEECHSDSETITLTINVLKSIKANYEELIKLREDVAEVKHAEIKYRNRPTPAKFAYVKGSDGVMYYGKLYEKDDYNPVPYCSLCNKRLDDIWQNYCPYCGAKLDGFKSIPADLELDDDGELKNIANGGDTE